jgi:hypothetical protein
LSHCPTAHEKNGGDRLEEAEMVEELRKRGYRVSKPKPKPAKEFEPRRVIVYHPHDIHFHERIIVKETPKFVFTKDGIKYDKCSIYEYDPEIFKIHDEAWKKARELEEQRDKILDDAREECEKRLKPVYPKEPSP